MDNNFAENIRQQTKRLVDQLQELEELKGELEAEEFESMKKDTIEQLETFQKGLDDMAKNNLSLNDQVQKAKLQIQAAVKASFNMDSLKQNMTLTQAQSLRDKISSLEREFNTKKIDKNTFIKNKSEQISKLQDLKVELNQQELAFVQEQSSGTTFVTNNAPTITGGQVLQHAEKQIKDNKVKQ